jgi:hypothetical protein
MPFNIVFMHTTNIPNLSVINDFEADKMYKNAVTWMALAQFANFV